MTVLVSSHRLPRALPKSPPHTKYTTSNDFNRPTSRHISKNITTPASVSRLPPADRAAFAVTSRLLASIVTEALLPAVYIPLRDSTIMSGICVILSGTSTQRTLSATDVYAILPLHHQPLLKPRDVATAFGRSVWLLDPFDMLPCVFELQEYSSFPGHFPVTIFHVHSV